MSQSRVYLPTVKGLIQTQTELPVRVTLSFGELEATLRFTKDATAEEVTSAVATVWTGCQEALGYYEFLEG